MKTSNIISFITLLATKGFLLCVRNLSPFPNGVGTAYEDGDANHLFLTTLQELAKTYATCDLVEEYIGGKIFPVRVG
jgi:hypothetical protein